WYEVASGSGQWCRINYMYSNTSGNAPVIGSGEVAVINDNFALRQWHFTTQYGANYNLQFARTGNSTEPGVIWIQATGSTSGTFSITQAQNCTVMLDGTHTASLE